MATMANSVVPWSDDFMEDYRWLDELLLRQSGAEKEFQPAWQAYKYLLHSKMYAYIGINDETKRPIITLKLALMKLCKVRRSRALDKRKSISISTNLPMPEFA